MPKNDASSPISPRSFHFLPVREIEQLRLTRPDTIHFCRVDSSRQVLISPSSRRINQVRSPSSVSASTLDARCATIDGDVGEACGSGSGVIRLGDRDADASSGWTVRPRTLNMCPQVVHLTVTPPGLSLLSSSSYSVWHFSQRTSISA